MHLSPVPAAGAAAPAGDQLSAWVVPALVAGVVLWGLWRRVPVYEAFVRGARSGVATGLRLIPYLVAMLSAVELLSSTQALEQLTRLLEPAAALAGIPAPVLPLMLLRPLSGAASMGYLAALLRRYGPDSLVGFTASVVQGSTETTLYVVTVYLGSVGIRDARWSVAAGLLADAGGFLAACAASRLWWGRT
ncbi:MAG TPA: nucleoside recognition domain-containing protein [Limnochordales bacterium]